jgi:hypothetical protein
MKSNLANMMASSPNTYEIKYKAWWEGSDFIAMSYDLRKLNEKQYANLVEIALVLYPRGHYD